MPRTLATRTASPRSSARPIDYQERTPRDVSPLDLGLVELPTRPRSSYTLGIRKEALDACEQGRLAGAADLTLAATTESAYLRGILSDLIYGILGLPMHWTGRSDLIDELDGPPGRTGQFHEMFPVPERGNLMGWGINLGVGVGQMRRKYGRPTIDYPISLEEAADGSWKLPSSARPIGAYDTRVLRTWNPKWLRNEWWNDSWWLMTADGEIRISPVDAGDVTDPDEWLLYTPYGAHKPWERGAWKSETLAFVVGRDAVFDLARHAELLGPVRVGNVPQGTTEKQRVKFLNQIKTMQRMGVLILPPGLDYKVVESTGKVSDIYRAIIEHAHNEFAMITGSLTTATGTAGFSKGDVQERFTRSILSFFADTFAECLHLRGITPWARENHGTEDAPRPAWDTAAPEDKKVRAETIKAAAEALGAMSENLKPSGLRLTRESVVQYVQSVGLAVEPLPAGAAPAARLDLAPTDLAKVVTVDEARKSQGLASIGDERGSKTIGEMDAAGKGDAPDGGAPPLPDAPTPPALPPANDDTAEIEASAEPVTDEQAQRLAVAMTQHGYERCPHGRPNRCPLCRIEKTHDVRMRNGKPDGFAPSWQPIARPTIAAAKPAEDEDPTAQHDALGLAHGRLEAALDALDELGDDRGAYDDEDERGEIVASIAWVALAYNPSQKRDANGRFAPKGGGDSATPSDGPMEGGSTKHGFGTSRAAKAARSGSHDAIAASSAAADGKGHDTAADAHEKAAAHHREAAERSVKETYRHAHLLAAQMHADVAEQHRAEHARATAPKPAPEPSAPAKAWIHTGDGRKDVTPAVSGEHFFVHKAGTGDYTVTHRESGRSVGGHASKPEAEAAMRAWDTPDGARVIGRLANGDASAKAEAAPMRDAASKAAAAAKPDVAEIDVRRKSWQMANGARGEEADAEHEARVDRINSPKTASDWSERVDALRDTKPRALAKVYGANPTPEQTAAHKAKEKVWNAEMRKAQAGLDRTREAERAASTPLPADAPTAPAKPHPATAAGDAAAKRAHAAVGDSRSKGALAAQNASADAAAASRAASTPETHAAAQAEHTRAAAEHRRAAATPPSGTSRVHAPSRDAHLRAAAEHDAAAKGHATAAGATAPPGEHRNSPAWTKPLPDATPSQRGDNAAPSAPEAPSAAPEAPEAATPAAAPVEPAKAPAKPSKPKAPQTPKQESAARVKEASAAATAASAKAGTEGTSAAHEAARQAHLDADRALRQHRDKFGGRAPVDTDHLHAAQMHASDRDRLGREEKDKRAEEVRKLNADPKFQADRVAHGAREAANQADFYASNRHGLAPDRARSLRAEYAQQAAEGYQKAHTLHPEGGYDTKAADVRTRHLAAPAATPPAAPAPTAAPATPRPADVATPLQRGVDTRPAVGDTGGMSNATAPKSTETTTPAHEAKPAPALPPGYTPDYYTGAEFTPDHVADAIRAAYPSAKEWAKNGQRRLYLNSTKHRGNPYVDITHRGGIKIADTKRGLDSADIADAIRKGGVSLHDDPQK